MDYKRIIKHIVNVHTNLVQLADRSGVSYRTLLYIRKGKTPTIQTLEKLERAMPKPKKGAEE